MLRSRIGHGDDVPTSDENQGTLPYNRNMGEPPPENTTRTPFPNNGSDRDEYATSSTMPNVGDENLIDMALIIDGFCRVRMGEWAIIRFLVDTGAHANILKPGIIPKNWQNL
jgi:hypothetical protein